MPLVARPPTSPSSHRFPQFPFSFETTTRLRRPSTPTHIVAAIAAFNERQRLQHPLDDHLLIFTALFDFCVTLFPDPT